MDTHDLTSVESVFIVVAFIVTGFLLAIFYYVLRFYMHTDGTEVQTEQPPALPKIDPFEKTRAHLWGRLKTIFDQPLEKQQAFEQLEEVLLTSDLGPKTVMRLSQSLDQELSGQQKKDPAVIREALKIQMLQLLDQNKTSTSLEQTFLQLIKSKPTVILIVGVNGAGKTTTIGKLAQGFSKAQKTVMVVAGDTFRAAAQSQLQVWAERSNVEIFSPPNVTDPAAVAFQGVTKAIANQTDVVIIDTAGRLHTQSHLMDELKKVKRVIAKINSTFPDETVLVLDANSGQNAIKQAEMFDQALGVTKIILTKLDGTAKGGVVFGLSYERKIPILFLGVGEKGDDLKVFDATEFVDSILK